MLTKIKEKLRKLPHSPGIYIFKDAKNKPLYIGKSSDLQNRIKYYLRIDDSSASWRIQKMLETAKKLDHVKTGSDIEALILESQYIKRYRPMFNIMLRDDKQYFFVGFTEDKFPKVFLTHQPQKFKNDPIGPFADGSALKATLNHLRRIFPYCTCKKPHNNFCLNYHIGKCPGFCCLKQSIKDRRFTIYDLQKYTTNIRAIKEILSGKKRGLVRGLEKEMKKMAKEGKLEEAIELRGKLEKMKRVFENAKIIQDTRHKILDTGDKGAELTSIKILTRLLKLTHMPNRIEAYDVANIQGKYAVGAMVVFTNGKPDKNEYRKFKIYTKALPDDVAMLKEVLTRRLKHPEWPMPDLILVDGGKTQLFALQKVILNLKFKVLNLIPVIALTKNERHRGEKIFVSGRKNAIPLSQLPVSVKNLMLNIDSEAHRFAISYYRKLHRKKALGPL